MTTNRRSQALASVSTVVLTAGLVLGSSARSSATSTVPNPPPTLPPQDPIETVFSTNNSNDRLLRLDFRNGTAEFVNTDADAVIAKRLEGITVRDDPPGVSVIAADSVGQRLLFYPNAQGPDRVDGQVITSIPWPDGVSLDSQRNLYLVSSPFAFKVWTIPLGGSRPGGYGDPVLIDGAAPSLLLEDTKPVGFSAGSLQSGDLLVLSRIPATIFRYRKNGTVWDRTVFVPTSQFPKNASPSGMSFSPNQELLVSTFGGTILRFNTAGVRVLPDFASASRCGNGRLKIAVGIQEGKSRAFVANRSNGGRILRFLIQPDGTGTPDGDINERVSLPNGVGIASNNAVPTPTGANVSVKPTPQVEIDYDVVSSAGLTGARIVVFEDNRQCPDRRCDQSLKAFFPNDLKLQALVPDVTVPAFAQAMNRHLPGDPPGQSSGPPTFLLAIIKTTAGFQRTALSHYEEEQLGIESRCAGLGPQSDQDYDPRTFYAPETGAPKLEPGLIEGQTFIDISDGCGSNKGSGWNFSLYLTGRDPSTPIQIMDRKAQGLRAAFNSFTEFISSPAVSDLDSKLADIESALADFRGSERQADKDATQAALEAFKAAVDADVSAFNNAGAGRNMYGELIARTSSALYILPKAPVHEPVPFSFTVGDDDGYANAFGLQSLPVPTNGSFPSKLTKGDYCPRDGRSAAERCATNGAQQTDIYSAMASGLPSSFDVVFPVEGITITSATFEVDMGSFEASQCRQFSVSINGVAQPGFFNFSDGPLVTRVRQFVFTQAQLDAANLSRPVKVTISRGNSTDKVAFDYFKLSGEVIP